MGPQALGGPVRPHLLHLFRAGPANTQHILTYLPSFKEKQHFVNDDKSLHKAYGCIRDKMLGTAR
jgi:hypothetical protein